MKNVIGTRKLGFLFTLILGASSAACGEDEGSGGSSSNTGGAATTGGGPATGGLGTTGGVVTTGGAPTTGGVPTTGGAPGTGGVTPTTGGAPITGGAPTTGGLGTTGGEPPTPIEGYAVEEGGFVRTCGMSGYSWVAAGPATANNDTGVLSSISPADFSAVAAGEALCAAGVVAADDDYGGYAMIGVNIGQEPSLVEGEETPNVNITPTGTGLTVSVTNNAGGALRVQIQDDLGGDDAEHRWCANLPASGQATIEWGEFNTACWDDSGTFYAGAPINAVLVLVPGKQSTDTAFDFCLNGFTQDGTNDCGTPGTGGAGGAGPVTGGAGGAVPVTGGAGGIDVGGAGPAGAPAVAGAAGSPVVVAGAASVAGAGGANGGATAAAGSPAAGQVSGT